MNYSTIGESSGVAVSRKLKGVLWTHNDSANSPEIFAVKEDGELIRSFLIAGAENHDWEDIALDERGNLYILDNTSRSDPQNRSTVYVLPEPDPFQDKVAQDPKKFTIRFPDGAFDCETLFAWDDKVYLVTKPWDGKLPRIYYFDDVGQDGTASFVGNVPLRTMITGGDITALGNRIVLSSYRALLIFQGSGPPETLLQSDPLICPLNARQVEGVSWKGEDLILTNEQREIFLVSRPQWEDQKAPFLHSPKKNVPFVASKPSVEQPLKSWPRGEWLKMTLEGSCRRLGRVVWSLDGLYLGIELPTGMRLRPVTLYPPTGYEHWFLSGSFYLMINPDGTRPLVYGENDRCILIGRSSEGSLIAQARQLQPATFIESAENMPDWIRIEERGQRLLVTLTSETPALTLGADSQMGFNLLMIDEKGQIISWTLLTDRFSWDSPSIWGLLKLNR